MGRSTPSARTAISRIGLRCQRARPVIKPCRTRGRTVSRSTLPSATPATTLLRATRQFALSASLVTRTSRAISPRRNAARLVTRFCELSRPPSDGAWASEGGAATAWPTPGRFAAGALLADSVGWRERSPGGLSSPRDGARSALAKGSPRRGWLGSRRMRALLEGPLPPTSRRGPLALAQASLSPAGQGVLWAGPR